MIFHYRHRRKWNCKLNCHKKLIFAKMGKSAVNLTLTSIQTKKVNCILLYQFFKFRISTFSLFTLFNLQKKYLSKLYVYFLSLIFFSAIFSCSRAISFSRSASLAFISAIILCFSTIFFCS